MKTVDQFLASSCPRFPGPDDGGQDDERDRWDDELAKADEQDGERWDGLS